MNRLKLILRAVSVMCFLTVVFTGCAGDANTVFTPSQVIDKTLSQLAGLNTCVFNFDFMRTQAWAESNVPYLNSDRWESTRLIDLTGRRMAMTMDISNRYPNLPGYLVRYVDNGWVYDKGSTYGVSSGDWRKGSGITDTAWADMIQIPYFIELLKSTSNIMWSLDEEIGGVDCYVEMLKPPAEAAVDWLLSQSDNPGQSILLGGWAADISSSREAYVSGYQSGLVRAWISKDTFQLVKLEIDLDFNIISYGNGGRIVVPGQPTSPPVIRYTWMDYYAKIVFDSYNQPVYIIVPEEARQAEAG